jgi:hypothetical protein
MKSVLMATLLCATCVSPASARVEPPLPTWEPEERQVLEEDGWFAGKFLLTDDPMEEESEAPSPKQLDVEAPTADELADDEPPASVIPEKYLSAYFGERSEEFIVDPQGLLSSKDLKDRTEFLRYHAGDSSINLYIYLFKGDQEIPGEVREEEIIERFFSEGKPAAVVYYYLGAPQRSVFYLSPSLTDAVSAAEQRRALQSSVIQAFQSAVAADQLEAFLVQMSIRLYWMERMLVGNVRASDAMPVLADAAVTRSAETVSPPTLGIVGKFIVPWIPHALLMVMIPAVALGFRSWLGLRARYHFPEFDVETRLGGGHAAGVGAVISFANAALPPASQRDQVPDYLRRA